VALVQLRYHGVDVTITHLSCLPNKRGMVDESVLGRIVLRFQGAKERLLRTKDLNRRGGRFGEIPAGNRRFKTNTVPSATHMSDPAWAMRRAPTSSPTMTVRLGAMAAMRFCREREHVRVDAEA
jgi:hypothetical protein